MSASPTPITACTSAIQRQIRRKFAVARGGQLDRERPDASRTENQAATMAAIKTPSGRRSPAGSAHRSRTPHRADQPHVHEVGPERRQAAVARKGNTERSAPRRSPPPPPTAPAAPRQNAAQQMPRNRPGRPESSPSARRRSKADIVPISTVVRSPSCRSSLPHGVQPTRPPPPRPRPRATFGIEQSIGNVHRSVARLLSDVLP